MTVARLHATANARTWTAPSNTGASAPRARPLGPSNQFLQAKLRVGAANDPLEREADRVADAVVSGGKVPQLGSSSAAVQAKCADCEAGEKTIRREADKEDDDPTIQTKAEAGGASVQGAAMAASAVSSGGAPLPATTRAYFEPRFGRDFSDVRIHTHERAQSAAASINARAYTLGCDIAFAPGEFSPASRVGRTLMAHELAHVVQQSAQGPALQRKPCLGPDSCKGLMTPAKVLKEANDPNKARTDARKKACAGHPTAPACIGDGHGNRAVETEKLLNSYDPTRLGFAQGIFVDMDLPFKAFTRDCDTFTPPLASQGLCVTVQPWIEEQAAMFNSTTGPLEINGMERGLWRERTLEILVHETEHARFHGEFDDQSALVPGGAPTLLGKPRPGCSKNAKDQQNVFSALTELGAMMQEYPMRVAEVRDTVGLSDQEISVHMEEWRAHRITGTKQAIPLSLRAVRCACACEDAEALIRQTIEFSTQTWTLEERRQLDREMTDPRWDDLDLRWPSDEPQRGDFPLRTLPEGTEYA